MSVFGSSNPPSVKLPATAGGRVQGLIVDLLPERQATKFQTAIQRQARAPRELDFWPAKNGEAPRPKMQQGIVLQLDAGFAKLNPGDNGLRTLYVTEGDPRSRAFRAFNKANRLQPEKGRYLVIEFVGEEAGQGDKPKQIWQVVSLDVPAQSGGVFGGDDEPSGTYGEDDVLVEDERELVGAGAPTSASGVPKPRRTRSGAPTPPQGDGAI
jgi:hypothetical protein